MNQENFLIAIVPIMLKLQDWQQDPLTTDMSELSTHTVTICFLYKESTFLKSITERVLLNETTIVLLVIVILVIFWSLLMATYISKKGSLMIFKPMRTLNMKMRDILADGMKQDLHQEEESSMELTNMYEVFKQLIRTKKFENNDFMDKEDALAVIDLAEACNMFTEEEPPNSKAAGICYNNIGNIQYKTGKYDQAAENFKLGVEAAKNCLEAIKSEKTSSMTDQYDKANIKVKKKRLEKEIMEQLQEEEDWIYFNKVEAHRTYLLAMSVYKHYKYSQSTSDNLNDEILGDNQTTNKWFNVDQLFIQVIEKYNRKEL